MARTRDLKHAFFLDEELAKQPPLGRILFEGLWTIADRMGRLEDRPVRIKIQVLPFDDCDADELLNGLAEARFILRYEVAGRRYIQIRSFSRHQRPHPREQESAIPPPPSNEAKSNEFNRAAPRSVEGSAKDLSSRAGSSFPSGPSGPSFPQPSGPSADHAAGQDLGQTRGVEHGASPDLWNRIREELGRRLDPKEFKTWFQPTRQAPSTNGSLLVRVPTPTFAEWIESRYGVTLASIAAELGYPELEFHFVAEE